MKRAGFTMIELIFVIVILGVLATVALPRFIGVSEQAEASKCDAFFGTMSRTVGPALWADMVLNEDNETVAFSAPNIEAQIEIPPNNECGTIGEIIAAATDGTDFTVTVGNQVYEVNATAATQNAAPLWEWSRQ